jgi:hypothetical protein
MSIVSTLKARLIGCGEERGGIPAGHLQDQGQIFFDHRSEHEPEHHRHEAAIEHSAGDADDAESP